MKKHWLVLLILITSCAPANPAFRATPTVQNAILTPRYVATLTLVPTTIIAKPTSRPVLSVPEQWLSLASTLQEMAQQAAIGESWEDIQLRKEGYRICNKMIFISTGTVKDDSKEILKRFRWGMEFMDPGQLREVIKILDQYN